MDGRQSSEFSRGTLIYCKSIPQRGSIQIIFYNGADFLRRAHKLAFKRNHIISLTVELTETIVT